MQRLVSTHVSILQFSSGMECNLFNESRNISRWSSILEEISRIGDWQFENSLPDCLKGGERSKINPIIFFDTFSFSTIFFSSSFNTSLSAFSSTNPNFDAGIVFVPTLIVSTLTCESIDILLFIYSNSLTYFPSEAGRRSPSSWANTFPKGTSIK